MLRALTRKILDVCLPRECPACRTGHERLGLFCHECEEELEQLINKPRCERCAMPATLENAPCAHCEGKGLRPFDHIACLGVMEEPIRSVIHRVKYDRRWPLAEHLADRIPVSLALNRMLREADLIVAVPLHSNRQRERGFNQAEVIARRLRWRQKYFVNRTAMSDAEGQLKMDFDRKTRRFQRLFAQMHSPAPIPAVRVRDTETQTHMRSHTQRELNLEGAFVLIDPQMVQGKKIVLVDDVLTTGATLKSLAKALQPAKPASVSAIVLAVADLKARGFEVI